MVTDGRFTWEYDRIDSFWPKCIGGGGREVKGGRLDIGIPRFWASELLVTGDVTVNLKNI